MKLMSRHEFFVAHYSFAPFSFILHHYDLIIFHLLDLIVFLVQVASALFCLRQRNTYQGQTCLTGLKPIAGLGNLGGLPSSFDHSAYQTPESGPHVAEVVESSRSKAQKMVDVAVQVRKTNKLLLLLLFSCPVLLFAGVLQYL